MSELTADTRSAGAASLAEVNTAATLEVRRMGREGHPLMIMDDVLSAPETLVEVARRTPFAPPPDTKYPGLNAPVPDVYYKTLVPALRPLLLEIFGVPRDVKLSVKCFFALATKAPAELEAMQKIPHTDSGNPLCIATVHYLCHDQGGGTAFFRHKATGFESIGAERRGAYERVALKELDAVGETLNRHVSQDTPDYEMIDFADLKFNRLVAYRSQVLHSGLLERARLSSDPTEGRLTITSLIEPLQSI